MSGSSRMVRAAWIAAPLFVLASAACGKDSDAAHEDDRSVAVNVGAKDMKDARFVARDSTRRLGEGDIRIASADSAVEVALIGDSLVAGLGARARGKVQAATDTATVSGSGMGASIEKMVKGAVAGALAHELEFPLAAITDVRYEEGLLRFYDTDGRQMHLFENSRRAGKPTTAMFRAEDAQAFIAAFNAKKNKKY